ncbi:MAG: hypothetical protein ACLFOY_00195 [Desulfatibacillaceae bacterium]
MDRRQPGEQVRENVIERRMLEYSIRRLEEWKVLDPDGRRSKDEKAPERR